MKPTWRHFRAPCGAWTKTLGALLVHAIQCEKCREWLSPPLSAKELADIRGRCAINVPFIRRKWD